MYLKVKAIVMVRIGMTCNHIEKEIEVDYEPSVADFNNWIEEYTKGQFKDFYEFISDYYKNDCDYSEWQKLIERAKVESRIFYTEDLMVYEKDLNESFCKWLVDKYEETFVPLLLKEIDSQDYRL